MSSDEGIAAPLRDRIFDAVLAELVASGIDKFNITSVANRAGVDPKVIRRHWPDGRVLLIDAMLARAAESVPIPDSGSLSHDLQTISDSIARLLDSELGRQWFHRVLPSGRDVDLSEVRTDFWAFRMRAVEQVFRRAAERGDLRVGVDPSTATQMLAAALSYDAVFNDSPSNREYTDQVRSIFLYGILAPHSFALLEDFEEAERLRKVLRATSDAIIDPIALVEAVRDLDGHVVDFTFREVNPAACRYLQHRNEDLVGRSLVDTVPDIESSGLLARYVRCVETGEPVIVEDFPYLSQRDQQLRRYDLRGGRAGPDWLSLTWHDVTDRHRGDEPAGSFRADQPVDALVQTAVTRLDQLDALLGYLVMNHPHGDALSPARDAIRSALLTVRNAAQR